MHFEEKLKKYKAEWVRSKHLKGDIKGERYLNGKRYIRKGTRNKKGKIYSFTDPYGKIHLTQNIAQLAREYDLNLKSLHNMTQTNPSVRLHRGWHVTGTNVKLANVIASTARCNKRYLFSTIEGDNYETNNINQFAREHDLNPISLYQLHKGSIILYANKWFKTGTENPLRYKKKQIIKNSVTYLFLSPENELHHVSNMTQFAKQMNIKPHIFHNLSKRLNSSSSSGWKCLNPVRKRIYEVTYADGTIEAITNLKEFCKKNNHNYKNVSGICLERGNVYKNLFSIQRKNLPFEIKPVVRKPHILRNRLANFIFEIYDINNNLIETVPFLKRYARREGISYMKVYKAMKYNRCLNGSVFIKKVINDNN